MVTTLELSLITSLQHMVEASAVLRIFAIMCARYLIFLNVPIGIWFFFRKGRWRHMAIEAAWAFTLSVALTESISHFTGRPRPFQVSHAIHLLIPPPWNASYPSGHTATSFALAFIFLYADWRVGVVSLLIAVLTALGRISVGVHFPTDVLAGLILGFVSFAVVRAIHAQLYTRRMSTAARTHRHDF